MSPLYATLGVLCVLALFLDSAASANNFYAPYTHGYFGVSTNSISGLGSAGYTALSANPSSGIMTDAQSAIAYGVGTANYVTYTGLEGPSGALLSTKSLLIYYNWTVQWSAGIVTSACIYGSSAASFDIYFIANMWDLSTNTWVLSTWAQASVYSYSLGCGLSYSWGPTVQGAAIIFPAVLYGGVTYEFVSQMVVSTSVIGVGLAYSDSTVNVGSGGNYAQLLNVGTN
jgi:hypothetical protein